MSKLKWCDDCQTEVADCEHVSHERKMVKIKEIEAGRENDLTYLDSRMYELWLIVNAEDLGRPIPSHEESSRASDELDRLLEKHHELTRRSNCDCHTCREKGWYTPTQPKPKSRMTLKQFLEQGDNDTDESVPGSLPQAHTPLEGECTCDLCKRFFVQWPRVTRAERWERRRINVTRDDGTRKRWTEAERADWRHVEMTHSWYNRSFIVVETGKTITIGNLEAEEFLAEYPTALELKSDDDL